MKLIVDNDFYSCIPDVGFKVWDYSVSHKMCLVRGILPNSNFGNIDIVFNAVERIECSTKLFNDLKIIIHEGVESLNIQLLTGKEIAVNIIAANYSIELNDLPTMSMPYKEEAPYERVELDITKFLTSADRS